MEYKQSSSSVGPILQVFALGITGSLCRRYSSLKEKGKLGFWTIAKVLLDNSGHSAAILARPREAQGNQSSDQMNRDAVEPRYRSKAKKHHLYHTMLSKLYIMKSLLSFFFF